MKTYHRLSLLWYWPAMSSEVRRTVRCCEICQMGKHSKATPYTSRQRLFAGRPWQKVAIDLVGPLPETPRTNRWVLVLSEHFTRWQDAVAIPDASMPVIAEALERQVFAYHGVPEQIHSDQGAQFESSLMEELCRIWGVSKSHTTSYHPQGNGVVERNNRQLGESSDSPTRR